MSGVPVTFYLIPIESPEEVEILDSAGDLLGVWVRAIYYLIFSCEINKCCNCCYYNRDPQMGRYLGEVDLFFVV